MIGLLAGVLARALMGGRRSLFASLCLGLAGALVGRAVAGLLGLGLDSLPAFSLAALAGATALLAAGGLLPGR
ncbi:MAG: GlsB/YeaQ/YmgE family stress response membrane protein [Caulobacter sp.]